MSDTGKSAANKLPTMMRFYRVKAILENDAVFKTRLGPADCPVEKRNAESVLFPKEVVDVTMAIHQAGQDAHHIPKMEVLKAAIRVLKLHANGTPAAPVPVVAVAASAPAANSPPEPPPATLTPKKQAPAESGRREKAKPAKVKAAPRAPKPVKAKKTVKAEKPKPAPVKTKSKKAAQVPILAAPADIPDSSKLKALEKEATQINLRLAQSKPMNPDDFPYYSVQCSIYSLLLSALNMSYNYEKVAGVAARVKKIEDLVVEYQDTCDQLRISTNVVGE